MAVVTSRAGDRPRLRSVLAKPGYRRLWAARTVSQCGDIAQFTTVAVLVYQLTKSGVGVTLVVLAEIAPVLLLAPLAGPIVDRLPRVKVMVGADIARVVLATLLVVSPGNLALVYVVAFGLAAGSVFFNPAAGSLLPTLVEDDELVAANSGIWSAAVLAQVLVAPAAGFVAATAGVRWAFGLNALSFALSAIMLRGLAERRPPRTAGTAGIRTQGLEALRLLGADRLLFGFAIAQALGALSAGATSALLVVLAAERFGTAAGGFGLMLAAIAVGAFLGPLAVTRLAPQAQRPGLVFGAFGLRGVVDLVLASVTALPLALGALVCYGVGTSTGNVTFTSVVQSHVAEDMRGRVFAAFDLIWQTMRLVSLIAGGFLADRVGVRAVFLVGGILLLAAALAGVLVRGHREQHGDI